MKPVTGARPMSVLTVGTDVLVELPEALGLTGPSALTPTPG